MKIHRSIINIVVLSALLGLIIFAYRDCFLSEEGFAQFDSDYQVQYLPALEFIKHNMLSGVTFLWNPLILGGVPFMANPEAGFCYLPNIICQGLLSVDGAYRVLFILHLLFAGIGIFSYVRLITDKYAPAFIAAFVFILCGPTMGMVTNCNFAALSTLSWCPVILLNIEQFLLKKKGIYLFFLSISVGISALAGELQMFSYMLIFCAVYILFGLKRVGTKATWKALGALSISIFWGVFIASVQVLPTIELTYRSIRFREYEVAISDALSFIRVLDLIFPEAGYFHGNFSNNGYVIYFGVTAVFFVVWSIVKGKKYIHAFSIMIAFLLLSSFGLPIHRLYYHLFPFAKYVMGGEQLIFPLAILIPIAAGLGWNVFFINEGKRRIYKYAVFLMLFMECIILNYRYVKGVIRDDYRPHRNNAEKVVSIIKKDYQQERIARFRQKNRIFLPNILMTYGIHDIEGFYSFVLERYASWLQAIDKTMVSGPGGRSQTIQVKNINDEQALSSPLINMLNVKYILSSEYLKREQYQLLYDGEIKLYQNLHCLPRAFLINDWKVIKDSGELLKSVSRAEFEPSKYVYLEKEPRWPTNSGEEGHMRSQPRSNIVDYKPDQLAIDVRANENSLLFISDVFYPGWKAFVDGNLTEIYRANYTFRAVPVPRGWHIVTFYYLPFVFKLGALISIISCGLAARQIFYK